MNEDKKSFIVYCDMEENVNDLTNEEAGVLFKSLFVYSNTNEDPLIEDRVTMHIFKIMRRQMDRDSEKWNSIKAKRSAAGKKGGEKTAKIKAEKAKALQEVNNLVTDFKQSQAKPSKRKQSQANQAVNVNVNENVNVNVNDNVIQLADDLRGLLEEAADTSYERSNYLLNRIATLKENGYSDADIIDVAEYKIKEFTEEGIGSMGLFLNPENIVGDSFEQSFSELKQTQDENGGTNEEGTEDYSLSDRRTMDDRSADR